MVEIGTYRVVTTRSGSWWAIEVPDVPGVFSQARRLDQVPAMAREALALALDVYEDDLSVDVEVAGLAAETEVALAAARQSRQEADRLARDASNLASDAARRLVEDERLTLREAAQVLGRSHQRVAQLLAAGAQRVTR